MNRRGFIKKAGLGLLGIPAAFKATKALTKEVYIVKPAYPKPDDDGRTFTGLTTIETQEVSITSSGAYFSNATPNGNYLSQINHEIHDHRYMDIRTWKRVTDKALISRLDAGVPYGGERIV